MKKTIVKNSSLALGFLLLISCNNSSTDKKSSATGDTTVATGKTGNAIVPAPPAGESSSVNQHNYEFEPSVSVISGTLSTGSYYGPPGYGDNPKTDSKEEPYILELEKPITVISKETGEDATNTTKENVLKIQLIVPDTNDAAKYKNKKVKLTGTFFSPHTGHHHTDVLLEVQKIEGL